MEELEARAVPATSISIANASVVEGDAGSAQMRFTVSRIGDVDVPLSVGYTTVNGTAIAGIDYTATSGKLDIPAGSTTATIVVPVTGDTLLETNRTFSLRLTDITQSSFGFASQGSAPSGTTPYAVTLGDVNADGKLDLVVANSGSNDVSVLLNTTAAGASAPTFAAPQNFATMDNPRGVTLGDVNGDGKIDLVAANFGANSVSVLINATAPGATSATFLSQQTFATGGTPNSVAINDLNGDGKPDLAVANQSTGNLSVLFSTTAAGSSALSFTPHQTFATRASPISIAAGDINGDGKPDLAVANMAANCVSVLLNETVNGSAEPSFALQNTFDAGALPFSMALADLNADGKLDFAVANGGANNVSVLLNQSAPGTTTPTFAPQQTFASGASPRTIVAGDVNGDGKRDLAVVDQSSGAVSVLLNATASGAATANFTAQQTFSAGTQPFAAALGDLNGDGRPDLAVSNRDWNSVSLLVNASKSGVSFINDTATGTIVDDDAPITIQTSPTSASTPIGSAFTLPTITVQNLAGNPVQNATVYLTVKTQVLADARFPGNVVTVTAVTGADGTVKPPTLTANNYVGAYLLGLDARDSAGAMSATRGIVLSNTAAGARQLVGVTPNGNIASLVGAQRSRVASLVVTFDGPSQLDPNALTLTLHKNNVSYNGVLQPLGYGSLPALLNIATTDNVNWIVTFIGNTDNGVDGFNSLKDGVYDLNIDAAKVHPLGAPTVNMTANRMYTFDRMFGDNGLPITPDGGTPGIDSMAINNTGDNLAMRSAFNKPVGAGYQAFLDFNGDGVINTLDNLQFRSRFNKALMWRA